MKRRTAGFLESEDALLVAYSTDGSEAHRMLGDTVPGVEVGSVSGAIRALVLAGHGFLESERLRRAYDQAVATGEPDSEAEDWYRALASGIVEPWAAE